MDIRKLICFCIAGLALTVGCGSKSDEKSTQKEIDDFKGKPLTPEQVAKLRGNMGGGGPMSSGPKTGAPAQPAGNR